MLLELTGKWTERVKRKRLTVDVFMKEMNNELWVSESSRLTFDDLFKE